MIPPASSGVSIYVRALTSNEAMCTASLWQTQYLHSWLISYSTHTFCYSFFNTTSSPRGSTRQTFQVRSSISCNTRQGFPLPMHPNTCGLFGVLERWSYRGMRKRLGYSPKRILDARAPSPRSVLTCISLFNTCAFDRSRSWRRTTTRRIDLPTFPH